MGIRIRCRPIGEEYLPIERFKLGLTLLTDGWCNVRQGNVEMVLFHQPASRVSTYPCTSSLGSFLRGLTFLQSHFNGSDPLAFAFAPDRQADAAPIHKSS